MKSLEAIDSTTDNVTKVITHALHDSCRKIELDKAYIVPYVGGGAMYANTHTKNQCIYKLIQKRVSSVCTL